MLGGRIVTNGIRIWFHFHPADSLQRLEIEDDNLRRASVANESPNAIGHEGDPVIPLHTGDLA